MHLRHCLGFCLQHVKHPTTECWLFPPILAKPDKFEIKKTNLLVHGSMTNDMIIFRNQNLIQINAFTNEKNEVMKKYM